MYFMLRATRMISTPRQCIILVRFVTTEKQTQVFILTSTASQEWITKTFGGVKPPERSGFATAVVGDHIYMYAGFRQAGYNADLWRLDTGT